MYCDVLWYLNYLIFDRFSWLVILGINGVIVLYIVKKEFIFFYIKIFIMILMFEMRERKRKREWVEEFNVYLKFVKKWWLSYNVYGFLFYEFEI